MANQFVNLPTLAADGAGAWVDVSAMGGLKTITVTNTSATPPFVTVECSNEDVPTAAGFTLPTFTQAKEQTFGVACHWMRAVTSNYRGGAAAACSVGSTGDTTSSLELGAPAGNGHGTPVDVSAMPPYKTVQVIGSFLGSLLVSVSEDGGTTYSPAFSFQGNVPSSGQTLLIAADFMRVERVGAPVSGPTPLVWVSATTAPGGGGGGGGGGSLVLTDNTTTVDPTTTLVMDPASGFVVHDDGAGVGRVTLASTAIISTARYTASGSETAAGFDINLTSLGIAQPSANYNAIVTGGGMAAVLAFDVDQSLNTTTKIHVIPTGDLTANDVLVITIIPFVPV